VLASSVYNATREPATVASCFLTLVNSGASSYPLLAGAFRVAQGSGSRATYANSAAVTIAAANTKSITSSTNATPIVLAVTAHGMSVGDTITVKNHLVNTNANGTWVIGAVGFDSNHVPLLVPGTLANSTGNGVGGATGTVTDPVQTLIAIGADVAGSTGTAGPGAINAINTPLAGVSIVTNTIAYGADPESNANLVQRCRDKLAALSPNGPGGAYDFAARNVNGPDVAVKVVSGALATPAAPVTKTHVQSDPTTGTVLVYVASASGPYLTPPNYTNQAMKSIASSTNANPISIHIVGHGYVTGDQVFINGHLVNTNANGSWPIVRTDADNFTLTGSSGNGVGGATGTSYRYSDLDLIDKSIQSNAVPDGVFAVTQSATSLAVNVVGTVKVPASYGAGITGAISTALINYLATFPMGGLGGVLPFDNIVGVLFATLPPNTGSSVVNSTVTVNGATSDLSMASSDDAFLNSLTITVVTF
jgi:hypothetical protein